MPNCFLKNLAKNDWETTKFRFCQSFSYYTKRTNLPDTDFTIGQRIGRGILYALILLYLFVGISIVSDRFMESIEMITSQEKEVVYKDKASGKKQVKIFNRDLLSLNNHFQSTQDVDSQKKIIKKIKIFLLLNAASNT